MSKFSQRALPVFFLLSFACEEPRKAELTNPQDAGAASQDSGTPADDSGTAFDDSGVAAVASGLRAGTTATSCGAASQGLTPVDCTEFGDMNAGCVFSNHCSCSVNAGFKCEGAADGSGSECSPGVVCVQKREDVSDTEVGRLPTSCGDPMSQNLTPIDCTRYGDVDAQCVFSNHCACSSNDGFKCETAGNPGSPSECPAGVYCVPN